MPRKNISQRVRFEVFKRDGFQCVYCGAKAGGRVRLEVDHVDPVAAGGPDDISNFVSACAPCNAGKSDRPVLPPEFEAANWPEDSVEAEVLNHVESWFHDDVGDLANYIRAVREQNPIPDSVRETAVYFDWLSWTIELGGQKRRIDNLPAGYSLLRAVPRMSKSLRAAYGLHLWDVASCLVCGTVKEDLVAFDHSAADSDDWLWMCKPCRRRTVLHHATLMANEEALA